MFWGVSQSLRDVFTCFTLTPASCQYSGCLCWCVCVFWSTSHLTEEEMKCHTSCRWRKWKSVFISFFTFWQQEGKRHIFQSSPWKGSHWNRCFSPMQIHYFIFDVKEQHLNKAEALWLQQRFPQDGIDVQKTTLRDQGRWRHCTTLNSQLKDLKIFEMSSATKQEESCRTVHLFLVVLSSFCLSSSLIFFFFFQSLCVSSFVLCVRDAFMQVRLFVFYFACCSLSCSVCGASSKKLASGLVRIILYSPTSKTIFSFGINWNNHLKFTFLWPLWAKLGQKSVQLFPNLCWGTLECVRKSLQVLQIAAGKETQRYAGAIMH